MPIYEFYCRDCHLLLNFFSARVDTDARPECPHCGRPGLERRPARFATLRGGDGGEGEEAPEELDEGRMEAAMDSLLGEMEELGESEDPRHLARMLRSVGEASGLEPGEKMREILGRLEAGEDPESLEDEMEDLGDDEEGLSELFRRRREGGAAPSARPPGVDEELYFL